MIKTSELEVAFDRDQTPLLDCLADWGVYMIKYIGFLIINGPIERINAYHMPMWRKKMDAVRIWFS